MLSPDLLNLVRGWWHAAPRKGWLFPGKPKTAPISPRQLSRAFTPAPGRDQQTGDAVHGSRHSFVRHLPEAGTDVRVIEVWPGHAKLTTTAQSAHVATRTIRDVVSPCELPTRLQDRPMNRRLE